MAFIQAPSILITMINMFLGFGSKPDDYPAKPNTTNPIYPLYGGDIGTYQVWGILRTTCTMYLVTAYHVSTRRAQFKLCWLFFASCVCLLCCVFDQFIYSSSTREVARYVHIWTIVCFDNPPSSMGYILSLA